MIIIIHGFDKLDDGHIASSVCFLAAGSIFLLIAIFHHQLVIRVRSVDAIFSIIEGILAGIVSLDYFNDHKHYIQYAYILVSAGYFIKSYVLLKKAAERRIQH